MKKVRFIIVPLAIALLTGTSDRVKAQPPDWNTQGNSIGATDFLGSTTGNFPLTLRTTPAQPIIFQTNGANQRMRISHNTTTNEPRVGIGSVTNPVAYLHLGEDTLTANTTGYRSWMNLGTLMYESTDNMYVGMRSDSFNVHEAIINWGNDPAASGVTDRLRFVFTANPGLNDGVASAHDGLEVARMIATNTGTGQNPVIEPRVGIGNFFTPAIDPQFTLDVNGEAAIRTVTQNNSLPRVLVVDNNNGGLIQYRDLSTIATGNVSACTTATTNFLTKWTAANTICNSLVFDNGTQVGIGTTSPIAKFNVNNSTESFATWSETNGNAGYQYGLVGVSKNATDENIGIYGIGGPWDTQQGTTATNTGVAGQGILSSTENYGGRFYAGGIEYATNYGVFAMATGGINTDNYAGFFVGDVIATDYFYQPSDINLKENIEEMKGAVQILSALQPKEFDYKTTEYDYLKLPKGRQYGFISQEVESILPNLTLDVKSPAFKDSLTGLNMKSTKFKALNYIGLIPLLVAGINEQQEIIDSLSNVINDRLTALESALYNCCGTSQKRMANPDEAESGNAQYQQVELANLQAIVLEQNVPNPFAEQTNISYFVPEDAGSAAIIFFDLTGRTIKSVNIEKGYGTITVFAQNLSQGTYSYSLVIDGKVAETKKMFKSR